MNLKQFVSLFSFKHAGTHAAQYPVCKSGPLRRRFISVMIPRSDLSHMKSRRRVRKKKNIVNDFPFSRYKYAGGVSERRYEDGAWTGP